MLPPISFSQFTVLFGIGKQCQVTRNVQSQNRDVSACWVREEKDKWDASSSVTCVKIFRFSDTCTTIHFWPLNYYWLKLCLLDCSIVQFLVWLLVSFWGRWLYSPCTKTDHGSPGLWVLGVCFSGPFSKPQLLRGTELENGLFFFLSRSGCILQNYNHISSHFWLPKENSGIVK